MEEWGVSMSDDVGDDPGGWAVRRDVRDGTPPVVTNGPKGGTNGDAGGLNGPALFAGWLAMSALILLINTVNVATILDDAHRRGASLPLWLPVTLEATSGIASIAAIALVVLTLRLAPIRRGALARAMVVHAFGTVAYSLAHVALMTALRSGVFAALGKHYDFSWSEFPYEYRKDLIAYIGAAATFSIIPRLKGETRRAPAPRTFDIHDGASILRIPLGEILAVRAAGNYVEFVLADGRRPLMRSPMAQVERSLGPGGFVRTHRSWIVNAARVREIAVAGSGDYRLDLGGCTAPLSRRHGEALARLKRGDAPP